MTHLTMLSKFKLITKEEDGAKSAKKEDLPHEFVLRPAFQENELRTRLLPEEQRVQSLSSHTAEWDEGLSTHLTQKDHEVQALTSLNADPERASRTGSASLCAHSEGLEKLSDSWKMMDAIGIGLKERSSELETVTSRLIDKEQIIAGLLVQAAEHLETRSALECQLAEKDRVIDSLFERLVTSQDQLFCMRDTLGTIGSCLLRLYGWMKNDRFARAFRVYGEIKDPHLLPIYRFLRLLPSEHDFAVPLPASKIYRPQAAAEIGRMFGDTLTVKEIVPAGPLVTPEVSVDIIVCIHDALEEVKSCLESVVANTRIPYSLILVDDGSNQETSAFLIRFAESRSAALLRNGKAKGYTFAANQGLRYSSADYVVLLNSDTVVTPGWLERILACGESDPTIGLVGPLSNSATWQSIPEIISNGEFASNPLPDELTEEDMGRLVAKFSARLYPRVPFLNGFCLAIKRDVILQLGYFDELRFGRGYGEENDYCVRASRAGWSLAVAEDAYVYHHQSRSYSDTRRRELCKDADAALTAKHGVTLITAGVTTCRTDRVLEGVRARARVMNTRQRFVDKGNALWKGKRIAFILPVNEPGGGANVVLSEAEAMRKMGVEATVLNLTSNRTGFAQSYHDNNVPVTYINREVDVAGLCSEYDAVVATWCKSVEWLGEAGGNGHCPVRAYYIQDFEPYFFAEGSTGYHTAWESYTRYGDLKRITKTEWNRAIVRKKTGAESAVVGASVNMDLYRPRNRHDPDWPQRPLRIAAMIRPNSPRRSPNQTLKILREISRKRGNTVEIILFGCTSESLASLGAPNDFPCRNAGILNRLQTAFLLNEVDVFVDFSAFQAMGLTALEAMCCGVAVIAPERGGAASFLKHGENGIAADTSCEKACIEALEQVVLDHDFRSRLQRQAITDAPEFFPERAAFNTLNAVFGSP